MDSVESNTKSTKNGFINHVFNFDNDTKCELLNLLQYVVLAIIPISLYSYLLDSVIPELDESKSNLEIIAEVLGQTVLNLLGIVFIHRLITFVPTYSGRAFSEMNLFSVILVFLVLGYESHTKVGSKTKILLNRLKDLWEGKKDDKKEKKKQAAEKETKQPISRAGAPTHQPSRADYLQSHNQMVSPTQMLPPAGQIPSQDIPQTDNGASNDMYNSGGFGGLQGAANVPMAANEGFGAFSKF